MQQVRLQVEYWELFYAETWKRDRPYVSELALRLQSGLLFGPLERGTLDFVSPTNTSQLQELKLDDASQCSSASETSGISEAPKARKVDYGDI